MSDIFISYASQDRPVAQRLASTLADEGWSVWWDRTIMPGKSFARMIEDALNETRCVVVLWSQVSRESDWVQNEARFGHERHALIPALIEEVKPPFEFQHIHAAALMDWDGNTSHPGYQQLVAAISGLTGAPSKREEEARRKAQEQEAKRQAEEDSRKKAEAEAARQKEQEERQQAEVEAKREAEAARREAVKQAQQKAEQEQAEVKRKAEEQAETKRKAEEEEAERTKAEAETPAPEGPAPPKVTWIVTAVVLALLALGIGFGVYQWSVKQDRIAFEQQTEEEQHRKAAAEARQKAEKETAPTPSAVNVEPGAPEQIVAQPSGEPGPAADDEADTVAATPETPDTTTASKGSAELPESGPEYRVQDLDASYVAVKTANVRAEPSATSERVGRLTIGVAVNVTGRVLMKEWYRIAFQGETAYVFAPLLKAVDASEISAWEEVKTSENMEDLQKFLGAYPDGHLAQQANRRLADLQRQLTAGAQTDQPRKTFTDCDVCPTMAVVPAGSFQIGSPMNEEGRDDDEGPVPYTVRIPKPFAVGVHEVTNAEFVAFLNAVGRRGPANEPWFETKSEDDRSRIVSSGGNRYGVEPGYENHPVFNVSWYGARAYADWLSKKTREDYRLLTEAEWEYVARAGTTTRYWWGDAFDSNKANNGDGTTKVNAYPPNPWGLHDVHGNVWEWVADCYHGDAYKTHEDYPAMVGSWQDSCDRVLRGGSWFNDPGDLRSADRIWSYPGYRAYKVRVPCCPDPLVRT